MRAAPFVLSSLLLCPTLLRAERGYAGLTRMNGRTMGEFSVKYLETRVKTREGVFGVALQAGIGALVWDHERHGEARVNLDAVLTFNDWRWRIGPTVSFDNTTSPALGLRTTVGYAIREKVLVGAYWEHMAGAPGSDRGSRSGLGLQVGFLF